MTTPTIQATHKTALASGFSILRLMEFERNIKGFSLVIDCREYRSQILWAKVFIGDELKAAFPSIEDAIKYGINLLETK